jgi:hypothetical protein
VFFLAGVFVPDSARREIATILLKLETDVNGRTLIRAVAVWLINYGSRNNLAKKHQRTLADNPLNNGSQNHFPSD